MRRYILYGAGDNGRMALRYFGHEHVLCFCDKNVSGSVDGIEVISPSCLSDYQKRNGGEIIITPREVSLVIEIAVSMKEMGLDYRLLKDAVCDPIEEDVILYNSLNTRETFRANLNDKWFCAADRLSPAGQMDPYMWQDLWAARHIYNNRPAIHYDIGSRIDGFITHLMVFGQAVSLIDIRPLNDIDGINFIQADATHLDGIQDGSIESLSALCSLEHFGLGRYGDIIDPEGSFKAFDAIRRKMKAGGELLIAVPVGREHVEFNAHRVFNAKTIIDEFDNFDLIEYSAALEDHIEYNIDVHKYDSKPEKGSGVFGLFHFKKKIV